MNLNDLIGQLGYNLCLDESSSSIVDFFTPVSPSRDLLVGFGRAVSDCGLTASIYDVMVTLNRY
jgi:hypothetical protein